jgi:hypothetical protein
MSRSPDSSRGLLEWFYPTWYSVRRTRYQLFRRDVAQPGRALAWGARGRQFKSARPDHLFSNVQRVAQANARQRTSARGRAFGSSNLPVPTNLSPAQISAPPVTATQTDQSLRNQALSLCRWSGTFTESPDVEFLDKSSKRRIIWPAPFSMCSVFS